MSVQERDDRAAREMDPTTDPARDRWLELFPVAAMHEHRTRKFRKFIHTDGVSLTLIYSRLEKQVWLCELRNLVS